jgi:SAM-dependent methyltransferase
VSGGAADAPHRAASPTSQPPESVYGASRRGLLVRVAEPLARRARRRRWQLYRRVIAPGPGETVIDVGCGPAGLAAFEPETAITGVDRVNRPGYAAGTRRFVRGDARALPFEDRAFDIAWSNSVIEHLDRSDRARFAAEIRRVAGRYFVETPNRWFPVEPHVLLPLFHFLPRTVRRRLWRFGVSDDPFSDIRLLGAAELRRLFPDAVIIRERFGPLTKSLIAAGPIDRLTG